MLVTTNKRLFRHIQQKQIVIFLVPMFLTFLRLLRQKELHKLKKIFVVGDSMPIYATSQIEYIPIAII